MDEDNSSPPQVAQSLARTSILCSNMPESLLDSAIAKKHFGRFGRVKRILLRPKKQVCIVDYDTGLAAQRALLNAGAYDGFMFDVTWNKKKKLIQRKEPTNEKKRLKEDDPDWLPDSDVEEELTAMSTVPVYRQPRQQPMQQDQQPQQAVVRRLHPGRSVTVKLTTKDRPSPTTVTQPVSSSSDPPAVVSVPTTMSTSEAAAELRQLRSRVSRTPDEQRRTLDARDRVLRAWGGTGSRVRAGGATIGTCPDMCPEKERLQRQAEHQVPQFECEQGEDVMAEWRAVKQYSRSSADQEMPMCYELRPPRVLAMTMAYLLREVADCTDYTQVSLADWFHFMWDRCRGIRKDIAQQALCCAESVRLVEQCARFHAHCAARLADLEHTQFDQRLNTDNLTKCLQTLKHMYADLPAESKPCEAEFRSYIALLNLGDANFCWEIKQLAVDIQKSEAVTFAVQIFMALDNNNYVRFFRLVREKATYLQACILLRYFNDVRARGLARIVKAFSPRGGSKYPVRELIENLAFEDANHLKSFIIHYGLKFSKHDDVEPTVILDRNQFIEDSEPYPISRAINLIESKRIHSVGEIIAGGVLPDRATYISHDIYSSFNENGTLKLAALLAEDLGYGTNNESNKDLRVLKKELERIPHTEMSHTFKGTESKGNLFVKDDSKVPFGARHTVFTGLKNDEKVQITTPKIFSFKPAIPVVSPEMIKSSPQNLFVQGTNPVFSFSKPEDNKSSGLWGANKAKNVFESTNPTSGIFATPDTNKNLFGSQSQAILSDVKEVTSPFRKPESADSNLLTKPSAVFRTIQSKAPSLFAETTNQSVFKTESGKPTSLFSKSVDEPGQVKQTLFANSGENPFVKPIGAGTNIFSKVNSNMRPGENSENVKRIFTTAPVEQVSDVTQNIFGHTQATQGLFNQKPIDIFNSGSNQPIFGQSNHASKQVGNVFGQSNVASKADPKLLFGGNSNIFNKQNQPESSLPMVDPPLTPKTLFKSAFAQKDEAPFTSSIFGENKVLNAAFGPLVQQPNIPSLEEEQLRGQKMQEELRKQEQELEERRRLEEVQKLEEQRIQEAKKQEEIRKEELRRHEEMRKREEERHRQEELRRRIEEEQKQAELKRLEEERRKEEEIKRIAEERRLLLAQIDRESQLLVDELMVNLVSETVVELVDKEIEEMRNLVDCAETVTDEILQDVVSDTCKSEMKAEKYLTEKLMEKFGSIWVANTARNIRRRIMVQETPIWLAGKSPLQSAIMLRRKVLPAALAKMTAFHNGYIFTGKTKPEPQITPYNIMDVARTSLLKGLRKVRTQYDENVFWKITVSSPGLDRWLHKQMNLHDWLLKKFSCKDCSTTADTDSIIYLKKHSWNNLMYCAISVSMINQENEFRSLEGSNGIIFYTDENDKNLLSRINKQLQEKSTKHVLPVAILATNTDTSDLEKFLKNLASAQAITSFKILKINESDTFRSVDKCTKVALKWLARHIPHVPPIETDSLKSVLLRCIGTELWYRLRLETHTRMNYIYKDLNKLTALYNDAVEKISTIITDESLHSYSKFPSEFKQFLKNNATYPKSYEFFHKDWANTDDIKLIRNILYSLRLPHTNSLVFAVDAVDFQKQIHNFCYEIDWFENPLEVAYKIISHLPRELCDVEMNSSDFSSYFEHYNFLDIINIVVLEKINTTSALNDKYVIYDPSSLNNFRNTHWWYDTELVSEIKHEAVEYVEDEIDKALNESFAQCAKRMRYETYELLALEDKDETLVEESITKWNSEITRLTTCDKTVNELEACLEEVAVKASNLKELLRAALQDE